MHWQINTKLTGAYLNSFLHSPSFYLFIYSYFTSFLPSLSFLLFFIHILFLLFIHSIFFNSFIIRSLHHSLVCILTHPLTHPTSNHHVTSSCPLLSHHTSHPLFSSPLTSPPLTFTSPLLSSSPSHIIFSLPSLLSPSPPSHPLPTAPPPVRRVSVAERAHPHTGGKRRRGRWGVVGE